VVEHRQVLSGCPAPPDADGAADVAAQWAAVLQLTEMRAESGEHQVWAGQVEGYQVQVWCQTSQTSQTSPDAGGAR
jgi:hypothetical protein